MDEVPQSAGLKRPQPCTQGLYTEIYLDLGFSEMGSHYFWSSFDSDVIFLDPRLAPRFRKLQTDFKSSSSQWLAACVPSSCCEVKSDTNVGRLSARCVSSRMGSECDEK